MLKVLIEKVSKSKKFQLPKYQSENCSGLDLIADIQTDIYLKKSETFLVPTGIKLKIPKGYEGQIRPRSGLALNHGITILNSPGTIDADFRGEIKVLIINHFKERFLIQPNTRIAQIVFSSISKIQFELKNINTFETNRSYKGFGSTGLE
tara:strand:- start:34 stop:483 length:450 start_codon:yes stop_codon:yes gene_type:complete